MMKESRIDELHCLIDLHLHLDGAISVASAKKLAAMQGIALPETDAELEKKMRVSPDCRDLNEFLEKFDFPLSLLQTPEALTEAVRTLLEELARDGLMYAEVRFAPMLHTTRGMTQAEAVRAALDGVNAGAIPANLILCCMRGAEREKNLETVAVAEQYLAAGVAALDLAGAEALFPTADYEEIFTVADEKNIPYTIHAGEAAGAESVAKALELGARRIGHGVHASRAQLRELADCRIPVEMCPTSNVCTQAVPDLSAWPLRAFLFEGVIATVNTDNPAIEGTTLRDEYKKLIRTFRLGRRDVRQLLFNAVEASFACEERKLEMNRQIENELRPKSLIDLFS